MVTGYSRAQIALHWVIFLLIAMQYILHEPIVAVWQAFQEGREIAFSPLVASHVAGGALVLVLVIWRLVIRSRRGAPGEPAGVSRAQAIAAAGMHHTLYLLMILMPVSGAVAWFGGVDAAAAVHSFLRVVVLVLVALHVLAALYHQFVLKNGLMNRMRTPEA